MSQLERRAPSAISEADIAEYRRRGVVVLRDFFAPESVAAIRNRIIDFFANAFDHLAPRPAGFSPEAVDSPTAFFRERFDLDRSLFFNASRVAQELTEFVSFGTAPALRDVARAFGLQRPAFALRPQLIWAANWMEESGAHSLRPLHQDWERMRGSVDSLVLWLPLTPAGEEQFPLEAVPGSHRLGFLQHEHFREGMRITDPAFDPDTARESLPMKPGDALFFSSLLVHASGAGSGDHLRMAISFRYNNLLEPGYIARGFPSGVKLVPADSARVDAPPTPEQVEALFGPA